MATWGVWCAVPHTRTSRMHIQCTYILGRSTKFTALWISEIRSSDFDYNGNVRIRKCRLKETLIAYFL